MVKTPKLREWLERYTGAELRALPNALIVPLGPKVAAAMQHLASLGFINREHILDGLPHPSGANAERIAFFLGQKSASACSVETNTRSIEMARSTLVERLAKLQRV